MPQFCLLFYAILQSWLLKGGGPWHNGPPKYLPPTTPKTAFKRQSVNLMIGLFLFAILFQRWNRS